MSLMPLSRLTVDIPAELINTSGNVSRVYAVIRLHNGEISYIEGTYADGKFTFETDRFSTYVLVYKDTTITASVESPAERFVREHLMENGSLIKTVTEENYQKILDATTDWDSLVESEKAKVNERLGSPNFHELYVAARAISDGKAGAPVSPDTGFHMPAAVIVLVIMILAAAVAMMFDRRRRSAK